MSGTVIFSTSVKVDHVYSATGAEHLLCLHFAVQIPTYCNV